MKPTAIDSPANADHGIQPSVPQSAFGTQSNSNLKHLSKVNALSQQMHARAAGADLTGVGEKMGNAIRSGLLIAKKTSNRIADASSSLFQALDRMLPQITFAQADENVNLKPEQINHTEPLKTGEPSVHSGCLLPTRTEVVSHPKVQELMKIAWETQVAKGPDSLESFFWIYYHPQKPDRYFVSPTVECEPNKIDPSQSITHPDDEPDGKGYVCAFFHTHPTISAFKKWLSLQGMSPEAYARDHHYGLSTQDSHGDTSKGDIAWANTFNMPIIVYDYVGDAGHRMNFSLPDNAPAMAYDGGPLRHERNVPIPWKYVITMGKPGPVADFDISKPRSPGERSGLYSQQLCNVSNTGTTVTVDTRIPVYFEWFAKLFEPKIGVGNNSYLPLNATGNVAISSVTYPGVEMHVSAMPTQMGLNLEDYLRSKLNGTVALEVLQNMDVACLLQHAFSNVKLASPAPEGNGLNIYYCNITDHSTIPEDVNPFVLKMDLKKVLIFGDENFIIDNLTAATPEEELYAVRWRSEHPNLP